jgi:hypothetical protein
VTCCVSIGTGCAAQYSKEGTLCRAIIMQTYSEDECKVLLIDYGTIKIVAYNQLFELPLKFQVIKPMATKFSLSGAKDLPAFPLMSQWFVESVSGQVLRMLVTPKPGKLLQYGFLINYKKLSIARLFFFFFFK